MASASPHGRGDAIQPLRRRRCAKCICGLCITRTCERAWLGKIRQTSCFLTEGGDCSKGTDIAQEHAHL